MLFGSASSSSTDCTVLTTFAGAPKATEYGGMFLVTMAPAPIVEPWPIVTPGRMMTFPPIQQSSPMRMGWPNSTNLCRERTLVSWPTVYSWTLGPIWTRLPMMIRLVSRTVNLDCQCLGAPPARETRWLTQSLQSISRQRTRWCHNRASAEVR